MTVLVLILFGFYFTVSSKGSDIGVDGLQRSNSSYAGRAPYSEERLRAQLQRSQGWELCHDVYIRL